MLLRNEWLELGRMSIVRNIYRHLTPSSIKIAVGRPRTKISKDSVPPRLARIECIAPTVESDGATFAQLEHIASEIPSMGGTEIGPQLRKAVRQAPPDTSIVEVGSWLGAGTAQLALGVRERGSAGSVAIHCYDRWEATDQEVEKAARMKNMSLRAGDDTLPWVMQTLRPFGVPINFVKCDLRDATWDGGPISVYLDDAAKTPQKFFHMLKTFGPHWIPGSTVVVLMDFHYWEKTGSDKHQCQKRFIENYREHFTLVEGFRTDTCDAFAYRKAIEFDQLHMRSLLAA
jgi:hypothetical protein